MRRVSRSRSHLDYSLLGAALVLLVLGLVMVYSASTIWAEQNLGKPLYFFTRQMIWAAISLVSLAFFSRVDYNRLRDWIAPLFGGTVLALIAALFFHPVAGVRRSVRLGPIGIQPAEIAKLTAVIFLASYLDRRHSKLSTPMHGLVLPMGVVGIMLLLIGKEPDLGTPVLMFVVTVLMLFVAGSRVRWIFAAIGAAIPIVAEELWRKPYRRARLLTFLTPFENIRGAGYQLAQSILAVGSGGWFGKGLGASQLKLLYLPTPHTDFIFPVVCEELGLCGALFVIGLFAFILLRGIAIARRAPNLFGALLASGISFTIVMQAYFNIAMAIGLLPTKGIALPFFSFGGSSLLSTLTGVGILLSISRQINAEAAA